EKVVEDEEENSKTESKGSVTCVWLHPIKDTIIFAVIANQFTKYHKNCNQSFKSVPKTYAKHF
ncbi:unnamed protein product, partial [Medioppia subpectinata]